MTTGLWILLGFTIITLILGLFDFGALLRCIAIGIAIYAGTTVLMFFRPFPELNWAEWFRAFPMSMIAGGLLYDLWFVFFELMSRVDDAIIDAGVAADAAERARQFNKPYVAPEIIAAQGSYTHVHNGVMAVEFVAGVEDTGSWGSAYFQAGEGRGSKYYHSHDYKPFVDVTKHYEGGKQQQIRIYARGNYLLKLDEAWKAARKEAERRCAETRREGYEVLPITAAVNVEGPEFPDGYIPDPFRGMGH